MSEYPVAYRQSPPEQRNRLTVFFRLIVVIPHLIWACLYGFAFGVVVLIAWFVIVFTARWPSGMYEFAAGFLRFYGRVLAYLYLVSDTYPPFDGGEHPEYDVTITIAPPQERYSRVKTGFRFILAIPVLIIQYFFSLWLFAVAVIIWIVAVFTGKTSAGLTEAMRMPMAYYVRSTAYVYLVTEDWPPFDPGPQ